MQLPAFSGRKKSINLLPKDSFETSGLGYVLGWALAFGKWVVILTQLIVMGAFVYRFMLDREATNLRRQIDQQKAVISSYAQLEEEFLLTQQRLVYAKPVLASQTKVLSTLDLLQSLTPSDTWYERLSVTPDTVSFSAYSSSLSGFSKFLTALSRRPEFKSVSVGSIQDGGAAGAQIHFDVALTSGGTQR